MAWKKNQWSTMLKAQARKVAAGSDKVKVAGDLDKYSPVLKKGSKICMDCGGNWAKK